MLNFSGPFMFYMACVPRIFCNVLIAPVGYRGTLTPKVPRRSINASKGKSGYPMFADRIASEKLSGLGYLGGHLISKIMFTR